MLTPYFRRSTLDDLIRDAFEAVITCGHKVRASRGECTEITGVMLELTDIRSRLSRSETKGRPFSALGEFCWYLSGRSDFDSIDYYLRGAYKLDKDVEPDGKTISGAYGPRLIGQGQIERVIDILTRKPTTRQAVLQIFDANDLASGQRDVPCTCTIQLLNRDGKLEMVTYMRSNDVYRGFPHDVFCFTLLQEWIACRLGIDVGTYKHAVGSLHLYDNSEERKDADGARRYLEEGFHSTGSPMPRMPTENSCVSLAGCSKQALRGQPPDFERAAQRERTLDGYWADLVRLLSAYRYWNDRDAQSILRTQTSMVSSIYSPFLLRLAQHAADRSAC